MSAHVLADHPEAPGRGACFHAHLAAEKALKTLLVARGVEVPYTHNLRVLAWELDTADRARFDTADLEALNPWAIDGRYPEDAEDVAASEVLRLVATAERVVGAVRAAFPVDATAENAREEE